MTGRLRTAAVLVLLALVAGGCSLIDRGGSYDVVAYFPRAVSLYESGAVQVLGLPAGEISDIEIVGDQVKVTMAIDDDVPIPDGVNAAIVPQSLIGERRVQLFPPYQEGDEVVGDGYEIPAEETVIPVEPDEALAALEEFLRKLDPDGIGRLIDNAATALDGQGENLGSALDELSELVGNFEENDDDIIAIAERFDDFTETLLTRESQLAQALDDFSVVADVLADEWDDIEALITGLADLSGDGLDLVSEHAVRLRTDIEIVTRLVRSVDTNLGAVQDLLDSGPKIVSGFMGAFNEDLRAFDLRNSFSPLLQEALGGAFEGVGVPFPCVDLVDVECEDGSLGLPAASLGALEAGEAVPTELARPATPIDDILNALGSPSVSAATDDAADGPGRTEDARSILDRFLGTFLGVGS